MRVRKTISILLSIIMLLALIPSMAVADSTPQYASAYDLLIDAINSGKDYYDDDDGLTTFFDLDFYNSLLDHGWWDYDGTATGNAFFSNTKTLAYSLKVESNVTEAIYYEYYYMGTWNDLINYNVITPTTYSNGTFYDIDFTNNSGFLPGMYLLICTDSSLSTLYFAANVTIESDGVTEPELTPTTLPTSIPTAVPTAVSTPPSYATPTPEYNVGSFINRCYEVALGRSADASGYNYWVENLNNGQACGAQVGYGFIFSSEYMNRNRSNEDFVKDMYSMYFGRSADAAGFSYWVEQLEAGVDREEIMAGFANSQEFYNLCDKYNVVCGTYVVGVPNDMQGGVNCFVARLYKVCLNRLPDMAGQSGWVINLLNEEATGSSAAYGFVFSQEFINLNLNNTEFVQYMYQAFFGREADSVGLEYWAGQLNSSKASREDVFDGFSKSQEFINLCDSYGIQANVIPTPTATPTAAPKVVEDYYVTKYTFDSNGESGTFFINSFVEYSADYVNSLEVGDSIDNGGIITKIKPLYSGTGIDVETTNGYFYFQLQENGKYYMFDDTGYAITNSIGNTKLTIADNVEIVDGVSLYGEYGIDRTSPYFMSFDGIDAYIDRLDDSDVWYAPQMVIRVIDGEVTLMVLEHNQPWHN